MTINWDAPADADPATVQAFLTAGSRALQMVKDVGLSPVCSVGSA
jgi:hypothetical protein